ncbi:right-handed parallel beta-helix repeat-containing protein [Bartonella schoenbuchensis]|uniref:right-handed parallel beta-helix repeat-containing protein n=1 Tax=Bartonella schoenbuchensis TaxID=165694 RepID=UPI00314518DA
MVTMNTVNVSNVGTGIMMEGSGTLTLEKGTRISFMGAYGVYVGSSVTSATLTNVTIEGSGSKGVGVYAEGGNLTVSGGEIKGVKTGISMEAGESLTVKDGTTINFMGNYGVYVGDKVTSATLTGVTITGSGNNGMGIYAMGGSLTVKDNTRITGVEEGIKMEGKGTLTVSGTTIQFEGGYGVVVGDKVTSATLTDVTITGNKSGGGIWVTGGSGNVTLERVTISEVKAGIYVKASESVTVEKGTTINFMGEDGYGVYVGSSVQNTSLIGVTITGNKSGGGTGIYAEGGSLTVKEGTITGVKMGVWVKGGSGNVTVKGVTIREAVRGIAMEGSGELKVENGTRIEFTGDYGVYVGSSVTSATLTNVTITGQNKGVGIYAEGENLTVSGGSITGVERGIWVKGGSLTVKEGTTITGVKVGIAMKGKGELKVEEGTRIEFTGSESYDYGVYVGSSVSKASLTGVTITGNKSGGSGVLMMGSTGNATLTRVNVSKVETGIYAMGGSLTVKKGTRIDFMGDYGVYAGKRVKNTSLMGVMITGNGNSGSKGVGV